jgi:aconitate hydratase A / 2-methylisocitrate dehydratase
MTTVSDPFGTKDSLETSSGSVQFHRLTALGDDGAADLDRIPMTVKVLLENIVRSSQGEHAGEEDVLALASWGQKPLGEREFPYAPARVILQDFTGVPAVVDLAAMRSAVERKKGDPSVVDPLVPVDLVIDHSVQVDAFGTVKAFAFNVDREYERNHERYSLLKWAQHAFADFRVVPPGLGIVHQVNLEHLASVVRVLERDGERMAVPDTLVGTDSHTTMINGLGVLGWGVGGIEAEAAMLGQPMPLGSPVIIGFRMTNELQTGVTATDLVLTITEILRKRGVVGKFVEFFGTGLSNLPVADRATISNMCPEYGATAALFPIDDQTLKYLRLTNRDETQIELVERYAKEQTMFRTDETPDAHFSETLELDLSSVEPSVAGPKRPQDRVALKDVWQSFLDVYPSQAEDAPRNELGRMETESGIPDETAAEDDGRAKAPADDVSLVRDGSVVIAAVTSCTNTSNPSVMLGAGLLAKAAVERGLSSKPWVKTSMAPGSRVVTQYLEGAGLVPYLEKLGFHVVGYGCTTCIGNSGPLPDEVAAAIDEQDLSVVSVLSGNRNFEGRIHPQVKASYLASPPLVVAFALAGTADIDLTKDPLGRDESGEPVFLTDIWPSPEEILEATHAVKAELFEEEYAGIFDGDERWQALPAPEGSLYDFEDASTYIQEPPFFFELPDEPAELEDIEDARVLVVVGDSVTTDHISPAGSIPPSSPAGKYLTDNDVRPADFNSYGSRRGNHEVMVRGTFANIRLRNRLVEREGGWTVHFPSAEEMTVYDAAMAYAKDDIPLIIIAGKEYGSGSSRDWAAKGPLLLGVKAVIAQSFERIHRSNLVGMGILPLQLSDSDTPESLQLDGSESFSIEGVSDLRPRARVRVTAAGGDTEVEFETTCRIDSEVELEYFRNGGVLQTVLRRMLQTS